MGAMATEDSPSHQKVAIWAPLGRRGDRKSPNESGGIAMATTLASGDLLQTRQGRHLWSPWRP